MPPKVPILHRIVTAATTLKWKTCPNLVAELLSQCSKGADITATDVSNDFPIIFIQVYLQGERMLRVPVIGEDALQASSTYIRAYGPIEFVNQAERAIESATAPAFAIEPA
ncbi:MAG TPA: hypothetical protein VGG97_07845 [Bryobacteraceae bacterium]|jgi:hypothetical protein